MNISFTPKAWEHYQKLVLEDKRRLSKINRCLISILREGPLEGEGKPEKLKHKRGYSRRIDEKNRLVYDVSIDRIIIYSCSGHYED